MSSPNKGWFIFMSDSILTIYFVIAAFLIRRQDSWPNGKALDYESRDSGFDPQRVHFLLSLVVPAIRDNYSTRL